MKAAESATVWASTFAAGMNLLAMFAAPRAFAIVGGDEGFKELALVAVAKMQRLLKAPVQPDPRIECPSLPELGGLLLQWNQGDPLPAPLTECARRCLKELDVPTPDEGWDAFS